MKFAQMSTKKLNALLETASEEEKVEIQKVLDARNAASAPQQPAGPTEEEQAAIAAAEAESNAAPKEEKPAKEKAAKMTDEQCHELAEKLRAEAVNHRCKVVAFNSIEWVDGTIVSIIEEKRTNKVMFAVKTYDGRRIVKAHDSKLIQILEDIDETKKVRGSRKSAEANEPWTEEEIEEEIKKVINNVGKTVSYPEAGAYGQVEEGAETVTGRIVSLVPAKRNKVILYRIELDQDDENAPKKYAHKVSSSDALTIAEELDEVGQKINEQFTARHYKEPVEHKEKMNEKQAFDYCSEKLAKAKAQLEKQQMLVEKYEANLEAAKKAYEDAVAEGKTFDEEEPEAEPEEQEAVGAEASEGDNDLM